MDITRILTERHANISLNLSFHINRKDFTFRASKSKKDVAVSQEKKNKSPSQKARNLSRWLEYMEKVLEKLETPTTPDKSINTTLNNKYETITPSVSCNKCGDTSETNNKFKLQRKNKYEVQQIDGSTSIYDEKVEEELLVEHFFLRIRILIFATCIWKNPCLV